MDHAMRKSLRILYGPYLQLCGVATKTSRFIMPLNLPPPWLSVLGFLSYVILLINVYFYYTQTAYLCPKYQFC